MMFSIGNPNKNPLIRSKLLGRRLEEHRWWARQDSNLQPDRYERPALTIELQAPANASQGRRLRQMNYMASTDPAMPPAHDFSISDFPNLT
jgi:hypothetical protein